MRKKPLTCHLVKCQRLFCLHPAPLSPCEDRVKMSSGGKLALWNHVPYCHSDGSFKDVQCNAHTGNCWCVSNNGLEFTETQSRKMPNCVTPSKPMLFVIHMYSSMFTSLSIRSPPTLSLLFCPVLSFLPNPACCQLSPSRFKFYSIV